VCALAADGIYPQSYSNCIIDCQARKLEAFHFPTKVNHKQERKWSAPDEHFLLELPLAYTSFLKSTEYEKLGSDGKIATHDHWEHIIFIFK
jgi:hypothetical protein